MSTTVKQTQQQIEQEIVYWEQHEKPANLAETEYNKNLIVDFLIQKYGGLINRATLRDAANSLRDKLQYLAQPEAPAVKKGTARDRLWNLGIEVSRHQSMADKEAANKLIEDKQNQFLTRAHLLNEQAQLLEEKSQAEYGHVVMHRLGINHYRTGEARKAAKAKLLPKLEDFNNRCRTSDNDNLVITI